MEHWEFAGSTGDGLRLFGQGWRPAGEPLGVACFVHGIGKHSGRWGHVGAALAEAGFASLAYDLRGHGRSAGQRGHTPSYEALLDDIARLLAEVGARFPGLPAFLYGHSLGGNLVLNYALRRGPMAPTPAGIIATDPWLRLAFAPPAWKVALGRAVNSLWPSFTMANGLELSALSREPGVEQAYRRDPLVHDRVTARLYVGYADAGEWALAHAAKLAIPTLLMHGGADRLSSLAASRQFAAAAGASCALKVWDGLYHEIHNEPEREQVLAHLVTWLKARSPSRT